MTKKARILIIDDDLAVCASLKLYLSKKDYEVLTVNLPQLALETIDLFRPDLVLLDLNFTIETTGKQGLKLLKLILHQNSNQLVILMTGWATVQIAVEGMKAGAKDFIAKPWDNAHLLSSIETILVLNYREGPLKSPNSTESKIIGKSPGFLEVLDIVNRVAKTDASILILGESGTGKEVIAEAIHEASKRDKHPFVKVNLGGIPHSIFESEMFGHKQGAFTDAYSDRIGRFELANKGTIFLDEIGELPLSSQTKMLRVLQEKTIEVVGSSITKKVDFRVISATNKDLNQMVNDQSFREDLFYRLNLITLHLPALRDRKEDIPLLVEHFIQHISHANETPLPHLENQVLDWISAQDYPGNIRQLRNVVERTMLLNIGKNDLSIKDFQDNISAGLSPNPSQERLPNVGDITLEAMERKMIMKTLNHFHHSISKTARSLGITRSSLYRRLEKFDIPYEPKI